MPRSTPNVPLTRSRVFAAIGLNGLFGRFCSCFEARPYLLSFLQAATELLACGRGQFRFVGSEELYDRRTYCTEILRRCGVNSSRSFLQFTHRRGRGYGSRLQYRRREVSREVSNAGSHSLLFPAERDCRKTRSHSGVTCAAKRSTIDDADGAVEVDGWVDFMRFCVLSSSCARSIVRSAATSRCCAPGSRVATAHSPCACLAA